MTATFELLPLARLARELNLSDTSARRLFVRGVLRPDFSAGSEMLFDPARVESLRNVIESRKGIEPQAVL